jgi:chromatin segregation and condensation protein Rec8/ScpA/Scc1 (kleisin family)
MSTEESQPAHKPRIIIAKNQEKIIEIFEKFPTEEFTQHDLLEQTQIKYPASVHSALMALVKKQKIERIQTSNGTRTAIAYKLKPN